MSLEVMLHKQISNYKYPSTTYVCFSSPVRTIKKPCDFPVAGLLFSAKKSGDALFRSGIKEQCLAQIECQFERLIGQCASARMRAARHRSIIEARHHQRIGSGRLGQFDRAIDFGRAIAVVSAERIAAARTQGIGDMFRTNTQYDVTTYPLGDRLSITVQGQAEQTLLTAVIELEGRTLTIAGQLAAQEIHRR